MKQAYAQYLINKTRSDYNIIGEHFSNTRKFVWKDLDYLKRFCSRGDKILDLGCGNARLLELLADLEIDYVGVDSSQKLINLAIKTYPEKSFSVVDALSLPFADNSFDKVFSIAVLHHIPSKQFRLKFFSECQRVLKPGGLLILSVWNLKQKRFRKYSRKFFLRKICGLSKLDFNDIFFPWKNQEGKILAQRYLHKFSIAELIDLAKKSGLENEECGFLQGKKNLYLVARKLVTKQKSVLPRG